MPRRSKVRTLPEFGSCFVERLKRTSRHPGLLSLRRYHRLPETIPARGTQLPSPLLQCAPVVLGLSFGTNQAGFLSGFLKLSDAESVNFHCVPNQVLYQAEPLPDCYSFN